MREKYDGYKSTFGQAPEPPRKGGNGKELLWLWMLPVLFFIAVGVGKFLPRLPHSHVNPATPKVENKLQGDWWADAPPVRGVKSKMALGSAYQNNDAGSVEWRGEYDANGTVNGVTRFSLDSDHWLIYGYSDYSSGYGWYFVKGASKDRGDESSSPLSVDEIGYDGSGKSADDPTGSYAVGNPFDFTVDSPAPTVTEVVADTTPPTYDSEIGASVNSAGDTVSVPLTEADSTPVLPATGVTGFTVQVGTKEYAVSDGTITNMAGEVLGYNAAGAGDSNYNKEFLVDGTESGRTAYSSGDYRIVWLAGGGASLPQCWMMGEGSFSDDTAIYYAEAPAGTEMPDEVTWQTSAMGTSPAPTVTELTDAASITVHLSVPVQIYQHDTVKVKYDSGTGNVTDSASTPNSMASFGWQIVDNGSTVARTLKKPVVMMNGELRNLPDGEQLIQPAVVPVQTLSDASTVEWDVSDAPISKAVVTLGGNRTLDVQNAVNGSQGILFVKQDGTGGRTLTLPSGSKVVNDGGGEVTLSSAANAVDALAFLHDGTNYYWTKGLSFS